MSVQEKGTNTGEQYDEVVRRCENIFAQKTEDYGTAWRVLRTVSVIDQIAIKALRIRTVQEAGKQRIADNVEDEFRGILNYAVIGLIQLHLTAAAPEELGKTQAVALYAAQIDAAKQLMLNKNHDYGEAWRGMSPESFVDLILMKLQRIKQILANEGKTLVSEGIDANFFDIINYAVFALIRLAERPAA